VDISRLGDGGMDRLRIHWAVVFQGNALLSGTVQQNVSLPLLWVKGLVPEAQHGKEDYPSRKSGKMHLTFLYWLGFYFRDY
jgi:ABC-type methionine transport system ATPase subunit